MELTEGLSYYYGALRLQSPLNPPFTQGGHGVGYPLYTRGARCGVSPLHKEARCGVSPLHKGACPLFAHASFLLIGKSLFLNPRTIRGFSLYKKPPHIAAASGRFFMRLSLRKPQGVQNKNRTILHTISDSGKAFVRRRDDRTQCAREHARSEQCISCG